MHVLILEDDLLIALDVEACVEGLGAITTDLTSSEENAIRLAAERRPDMIVSDVRLASGTGPSAVRRIRELYGDIPTVYVTGNPEAARQADPQSAVIVKPLRWSRLAEVATDFGVYRQALAS